MLDRLRALATRTRTLLVPEGDVSDRTVKSGVWSGGLNVVDRLLQLSMIVILANLLTPNDFGLFGIGLVVLASLLKISKLGLEDALIYNEGADVDDYLDTTLTLQVARGLALAGTIYVGAPVVASVFGEPRATDVLRVIAISPILVGLRNPAVIYFRKHLEFHKYFVYFISGSVVQFVVGVGLALLTRSVWALVIAFVLGDLTRTAVSYVIHRYRPRLEFDVGRARELVGYGKWITGFSVLSLVYRDGDEAIVGWLLGATALGYYQVAYRLANAPTTEIGAVVTSVLFPTFSKFQDDVPRLRESFFRSVQLTTFFSFPAALGIGAVAPTFVRGFLGPEWLPMVTVIQVLAGLGFLESLTISFGPVWKAIGRPDYETKLATIRVALLLAFIYPATVTYGIEGAAAVVLGAFLALVPPAVYLVVHSVETTYTRFARELAYPVAASLVMVATVLATDALVSLPWAILEFFLLVGVGVATYAGAVLVLTTAFSWQIRTNLRSIVDVFRG